MSEQIWAKTGVLCEMSQLNATISIFPSHCILHNGGIGWLRFFFSMLADTLYYFLSRSESAKQFPFNFYIVKVVKTFRGGCHLTFICSDRSKFCWVNCVRLFCFHNVYIWIPLNFVDLFMTWSSNLMKAKSRSVILVGGSGFTVHHHPHWSNF